MVNISASATDQIPGLRKVAILMVMIGDEASAAILRELDQDEDQGKPLPRFWWVHALGGPIQTSEECSATWWNVVGLLSARDPPGRRCTRWLKVGRTGISGS